MRISKNDEKWMANYEALKAYIDDHHHLPPKDAPLGAKYLLNWCKYVTQNLSLTASFIASAGSGTGTDQTGGGTTGSGDDDEIDAPVL